MTWFHKISLLPGIKWGGRAENLAFNVKSYLNKQDKYSLKTCVCLCFRNGGNIFVTDLIVFVRMLVSDKDQLNV